MAKFYVESGSVQAVVDCVDVEGAALWAVNLVMDSSEPLNNAESLEILDEEDSLQAANSADSLYLDETIRVSERGFGRADADVVPAASAIQEWFELSRAISLMCHDWE